jgi:hypothetical protein
VWPANVRPAPHGPQVGDAARSDRFTFEADRRKPLDHERLTSLIVGRDGCAFDQRFGEGEGAGHGRIESMR